MSIPKVNVYRMKNRSLSTYSFLNFKCDMKYNANVGHICEKVNEAERGKKRANLRGWFAKFIQK